MYSLLSCCSISGLVSPMKRIYKHITISIICLPSSFINKQKAPVCGILVGFSFLRNPGGTVMDSYIWTIDNTKPTDGS